MIVRRFADIRIGFEKNDLLADFGLPQGFRVDHDESSAVDIHFSLEIGRLEPDPIQEQTVEMRRGPLHATGNRDRVVWSHAELGPIIESRPRDGRVVIALRGRDWEKTSSVFDQLILPGILPPLAARGVRAVHASSVQLQSGAGVMIAGPSGCGKTTAALMLVANGANFVADDLTFIRRRQEGFSILGMGEGPRAVQEVWSKFSHWQPGKADLVGKRRLHPNAISWVTEARLQKVLVPSEHRSMVDSVHAWMLTELMGYTYHAGDQDVALHQLTALVKSVQLLTYARSDEAANLAMRKA